MADFISTRLATEWTREDVKKAMFWERLLFFIPKANPNYDRIMHLVDSWLIEFPDDHDSMPWREIGLDSEGIPVLAGPTARDYGFWLDTNMKLEDFTDAEEIAEELFEDLWTRFFDEHPDRHPVAASRDRT